MWARFETYCPAVAGCRLPLETDYRDFWEFPYPQELRSSLMHGLDQARSMLAWIRSLAGAGIPEDRIEIVPRSDAYSAIESIGGCMALAWPSVPVRLRQPCTGSSSPLVAPQIGSLPLDATSSYRPFDVIDRIRIRGHPFHDHGDLVPLVVLDDAHTLHPEQFDALRRWLIRRELRVSRWLVTRMDVLNPAEAARDDGGALDRERASRYRLTSRSYGNHTAGRWTVHCPHNFPSDGAGHGGPLPTPDAAVQLQAVDEPARSAAERGGTTAECETEESSG